MYHIRQAMLLAEVWCITVSTFCLAQVGWYFYWGMHMCDKLQGVNICDATPERGRLTV